MALATSPFMPSRRVGVGCNRTEHGHSCCLLLLGSIIRRWGGIWPGRPLINFSPRSPIVRSAQLFPSAHHMPQQRRKSIQQWTRARQRRTTPLPCMLGCLLAMALRSHRMEIGEPVNRQVFRSSQLPTSPSRQAGSGAPPPLRCGIASRQLTSRGGCGAHMRLRFISFHHIYFRALYMFFVFRGKQYATGKWQ